MRTVSRVDVGEVIGLEIQLPSGKWLQLRGEVTSCQDVGGFGLQFTFITEDEESALRELLS